MRIFVAGASGVIGVRLVPLLVAAGHDVAGMTRSVAKLDQLQAFGAEPVLCDVYDAEALAAAVMQFHPDMVMQQLTDLPDDATQVAALGARNDRMWREGTRNLLTAASATGAPRFFAQSIAWQLPGDRGVATLKYERSVLDAAGVMIRYGQLYGPDTYYPDDPPPPPRIHIDDAARRTVTVLDAPSGVVELVE
jgi:nucleoside-diphosphate-sugar epimerase